SARRGQRYPDLRSFRESITDHGVRIRYTKGQLRWESDPDVSTYFADLQNRPFDGSELYFENRREAPLPDIVCRAHGLRLRTRFHTADDRIEHEVLCEPPGR